MDGSSVTRSRLGRGLGELRRVTLVGECSSVERGLALARRAAPDLVVLDMRLQGAGSIRRFKALRPPPRVAVLTSFVEPPYCERCLEWGADYCFDKARALGRLAEILAALRPEMGRRGSTGGPDPGAEAASALEAACAEAERIRRSEEGA